MTKYHNLNLNVNALASPSRSWWLVLHSPTFNPSEFGSFLPLVLWTSPKNFTFLAHGFQGFLGSPSLEPLAIGWSPEGCMAVVILLSFFFCKIFTTPFCHLSILTQVSAPLLFQVFDHSNPLTFVSMHSQPYFMSPNSLVSSTYPWKFLKVNSPSLPHKFKSTPSQFAQRPPRFLSTFNTLYLSKLTWPTPSTTSGLTPSPITLPILYVRFFWYFITPSAYPSITYVC